MRIWEYTANNERQRKMAMIIEGKQTTVAYRCPHCGGGVMSAVGIFSLNADMVKLKCDCGKSHMTVVYGKDDKIRITVPCMVCPNPHQFTVSKSLFFEKELFVLPCPYSDLNVAVMGDMNLVKAELARGELELLDLLEKSGIEDPERLRREAEELPDPQIMDIVMFVIRDLDAEGKIYCRCDENSDAREYEAQITPEGILVSCKSCGASRLIPTDSGLSAHAFLNADALYLE